MSGREWVVGFLLSEDGERVVLIRKNRPPWQKGRLNGVGGKVEEHETPGQAMTREFLEEANVSIPQSTQLSDGRWTWGWGHFLSLTWEEGVVHFFRCFSLDGVLDACRTMTDESIEQHRVCTLNQPGPGLANVTPNLLWLVPLAAHKTRRLRHPQRGGDRNDAAQGRTCVVTDEPFDTEASRAICEAATLGPWQWGGNVNHPGGIELRSKVSGWPTVMGFRRWGMQGAEPFFYERNDPTDPGWSPARRRAARDIAVREVPYRGDVVAIGHPDAIFIAHARTALPAALDEIDRLRIAALDEIDRLRIRLRGMERILP